MVKQDRLTDKWEKALALLKDLEKRIIAARTNEREIRFALQEYMFTGDLDESKFSTRERQVLAGVKRGLGNKEIANELNISERTIKFHVSNILAKTNCTNRRELMKGR